MVFCNAFDGECEEPVEAGEEAEKRVGVDSGSGDGGQERVEDIGISKRRCRRIHSSRQSEGAQSRRDRARTDGVVCDRVRSLEIIPLIGDMVREAYAFTGFLVG